MQSVEFDVLAEKHQRGLFAIVEGGKGTVISQQIRNRGFIPCSHLKWQLSFAADAQCLLDIPHLKPLSIQLLALPCLKAREVWNRLGNRLHERNGIRSLRFSEPAAAHVVEQQVPF